MASLQQKWNLFRGITSSQHAYNGPLYTSIDVTHRCNLQCLCCRFHSPLFKAISKTGSYGTRDFSFPMYEALCRDLSSLNSNKLIYDGEGEPILHPQIYDMISTAKQNNLDVLMFSNGVLLNRDRVQGLLDAKLDTLKISLWAKSEKEYEQNYPGTKSEKFHEVIQNMKDIKKLKEEKSTVFPSVEWAYPINRNNFENLEETVAIAEEVGCDVMHYSLVKIWGEELAAMEFSTEEYLEIAESLKKIRVKLDQLKIRHNINEVLIRCKTTEEISLHTACYVGWFHARIRIDGTVFPCSRCKTAMGKLSEESFTDIWNGSRYQAFRKRVNTREGLAKVSEQFNCNLCCHMHNNVQVHKTMRWFPPYKPYM